MAEKNFDKEIDLLKDRLKSNNINGLYLFCGPERYRKSSFINSFKNQFSDNPMPEFNIITFDGKETSFDTLLGAVESYPVMADNKLIIIKDSGIFKKVKEEDKELWSELFDNIPDYCVVLFDETEVDGRSVLTKKAQKNGMYIEFTFLKPAQLTSWINNELKKQGYTISKNALEEFIFRIDGSMGSGSNEAMKLIDYCGQRKEITLDDVCNVVTKSLQDRVFDMLDNITKGNRKKVFSILSDLKQKREEPLKILVLVGNTISNLLKTKVLLNEGNTNIASALGLAPFVATKYSQQCSKLSLEKLKEMLDKCAKADAGVKLSSGNPWIILETLLIELSAK
ncbi:MAG: DNA polymerase III subunit delta [Clostridia bacterium]|nr:DNA polymerase III subunit delta [Clostridia bacterium]